jgi:hypothetical protein
MKFLTLLILVFLLQGCKPTQKRLWHKKDMAERKLKPMTYWGAGDVELEMIYVYQKVFKKYGLKYQMVAGCQLNNTISNSIQWHNKWVIKKARFNNSKVKIKDIYNYADSIYKIDSTILNYAQQNNNLTKTIYGILDTIRRTESTGRLTIENCDKKNTHILNYNEIDGYGKRQRLLLSIEIVLPEYTFRILTTKI